MAAWPIVPVDDHHAGISFGQQGVCERHTHGAAAYNEIVRIHEITPRLFADDYSGCTGFSGNRFGGDGWRYRAGWLWRTAMGIMWQTRSAGRTTRC